MTKLSSISAFLIGLTLTFCVTLLGLVFGIYYQDTQYSGRIYPEVAIDGILQKGKTPDEAKKYFTDLNARLSALQLEVFYQDSPVATHSGEMVSLHSNGTTVVDRAYQVGRSGSTLNQLLQRFSILTRIQRHSFTSNIDYTIDPILETIAILEKQYTIEPKNALFSIKDGKVSAFAQEKDGLVVNSADATRQVRALLSFDSVREIAEQPNPLRITVTSSVLKPKISLADANTFGIQEIIGVGTSDYSGSIPERVHNLLLATNRINGTLVPQGELFSYNNSIGEISAATGYKPAYVILNGRTVLGDGGGVCQTSTTMFRAAIKSGLPIVAWAPHAYRVHYYENDST
ncbi:VanW family protein, partial [Candidatus Woesebacteria bacterium]|nr:VanW family protein [Candidatus Woesebacteria bacterium]